MSLGTPATFSQNCNFYELLSSDDKLQAPDVQKLDSAICWINHYPVDNTIGFPNTYPLDGDLSGG